MHHMQAMKVITTTYSEESLAHVNSRADPKALFLRAMAV